jgi:hypothetical protein
MNSLTSVQDLTPFLTNYIQTIPASVMALPEVFGVLMEALPNLVAGLPHVLNVFGLGQFLPPGTLS